MTPAPGLLALAAAALATACVNGHAGSVGDRLALMERAFAVRQSSPRRAAELFAAAGPGTVLERVRLEAWIAALEASGGRPSDWQHLLDAHPPADLQAECRLGLARALIAASRTGEAAASLDTVEGPARADADALLLTLPDGPWRRAAAHRLAVAAPKRLRNEFGELEREVLPELTVDEWLTRAARWRAVGDPQRAAVELRGRSWRGDDERRRRMELARSEIEAGSPGRALRALAGRSDGAAMVLRAEAYRRRGWQRVPRASAGQPFRQCLDAAGSALTTLEPGSSEIENALRLVLECATEVGELEAGLTAWWRLEAAAWRDPQREWLGRRLGVALARRGGADAVLQLASCIPRHFRCLRFWLAVSDKENSLEQLRQLAEADVPDLYAQWSREILGTVPPETVMMGSPVEPAEPPSSVRWLIDRDAEQEAAAEWRRIAEIRGSSPGEALAAARFERALGHSHDAIRWLRRGFPELGTVAMAEAPEAAIREYLPLEWDAVLRQASRASDIEPWLLAGVARQESVFVSYARSPRGALGVLQLVPTTARLHGRALGLSGTLDLFDPEVNIHIGARELARLRARFGAVEPALVAYNAGETRARRWWQRWPDRRHFTEAIPIPESYNYVRRVSFLAEAYRLAYHDVWRRSP